MLATATQITVILTHILVLTRHAMVNSRRLRHRLARVLTFYAHPLIFTLDPTTTTLIQSQPRGDQTAMRIDLLPKGSTSTTTTFSSHRVTAAATRLARVSLLSNIFGAFGEAWRPDYHLRVLKHLTYLSKITFILSNDFQSLSNLWLHSNSCNFAK